MAFHDAVSRGVVLLCPVVNDLGAACWAARALPCLVPLSAGGPFLGVQAVAP